eukprot:CAMPEP_0178436054 /NCGR_PEP_ID=MMETSP0689_2-20121128/34244_1 /TAXON_ID=160604 /ORGANISM="Amphidinium massartii, Strain CS-259" /LENGTH=863 /DNA_ID=CAMNT_0020058143 /DNA_START=49 /DNA_END=2640 /DNA_ORIENTATION=-
MTAVSPAGYGLVQPLGSCMAVPAGGPSSLPSSATNVGSCPWYAPRCAVVRSSTPTRLQQAPGTPTRAAGGGGAAGGMATHFQVPTPVRNRNAPSGMSRQHSCHTLGSERVKVDDRRGSLALHPNAGETLCSDDGRHGGHLQAVTARSLAGRLGRTPSTGQLSSGRGPLQSRALFEERHDRAGDSVGLPRGTMDALFASSTTTGPAVQQAAMARALTPPRISSAPRGSTSQRGQPLTPTVQRTASPARRSTHTPRRTVPVEVETLSAPQPLQTCGPSIRSVPSSLTAPRPRSTTPPRPRCVTPPPPPRNSTPPRQPEVITSQHQVGGGCPSRTPTRSRTTPKVKHNTDALREWCLGLSRLEPKLRPQSAAQSTPLPHAEDTAAQAQAPPERQNSVVSLGAEDPDKPRTEADAICVEKVSLSPRPWEATREAQHRPCSEGSSLPFPTADSRGSSRTESKQMTFGREDMDEVKEQLLQVKATLAQAFAERDQLASLGRRVEPGLEVQRVPNLASYMRAVDHQEEENCRDRSVCAPAAAAILTAENAMAAEPHIADPPDCRDKVDDRFGGSWGAQPLEARFGTGSMSPQPWVATREASPTAAAAAEATESGDAPFHSNCGDAELQEPPPAGDDHVPPVASLIGSMQIQPELWLPPFSSDLSGANLELSEDGYTATRVRGCRQSVTISSAPLTRHQHGLYFEVEVRETVDGWVGGLGIGVTQTAPKTLPRLPDKAWRVPNTFIIGYAGAAYLNGQEQAIPWQADSLRAGDTVGLLVSGDGRGDMLLFVNKVYVLMLQGPILENAGLTTQPLYPLLDIFAATRSVTLLPCAEPPIPPPAWQRVTDEVSGSQADSSPDVGASRAGDAVAV